MVRKRYHCEFTNGTSLDATGERKGTSYGSWILSASDVVVNGNKVLNTKIEDIYFSDFTLTFFTVSKIDTNDNDTENR